LNPSFCNDLRPLIGAVDEFARTRFPDGYRVELIERG